MQRVNASGELIWPDNGFVITDQFTSFNVAKPNPAVSYGAGGMIILYADSSDAKFQRINTQGNFLWGDSVETIYINGRMFQNNRKEAIMKKFVFPFLMGLVLKGNAIFASSNDPQCPLNTSSHTLYLPSTGTL